MRNPQRLLALVAIAVLPTFTVACGGGADQTAAPPTTEAPASTEAPSTAEDAGRYTVATAAKNGTVQIYKSPDEAQKASTLKNPRLINDDPNAKVPLVMLVEEQQGDWLKVSLPIRPNGSTGWVKKSDFKLTKHDYHMEIALSDFNLKAFRGDEQIFDAKIGVAQDNTPTPNGTYYTTELLQPPDPKGAYGPYAYGLSGHSDVLTSFEGGPGQLGIHGTNEPQNIGKKVSHGCIRLTNDNVTKLVDIGMPLGTPVIIKA